MLYVLGIGLNTVVLILSIFTVFPDVATNTTVKNLLCLIIIAVQLLSILIGNLYQKHVDREKLGENVSRSELIKGLAPYKHDSVLGAREEMRQGLVALTSVFMVCCIYWGFMTGDALKFVAVVCIVAITFIYADYITHNSFYTKRYDEKFKKENETPNSFRGLARIYRYEYAHLGFKRFSCRREYNSLSTYIKAQAGLQDKCIECILFSKIDAIKNPEIYYGAVIMFFNIFLILPNAADKAIEGILPVSIDVAEKVLPYILVAVNVVFAVINIVSMALYERKSKFIATVANALSDENAVKNRYDLYKDIEKEYDFKLIRARGIYVFNSIAIDKGEGLDKHLDKWASEEDRREESIRGNGVNRMEYLKYRMLFTHRFHTNFQRFLHTVILGYIALLCLLLDLKIDILIIGIIFAIISVLVLSFALFILPNIGRNKITRACKDLNQNDKDFWN